MQNSVSSAVKTPVIAVIEYTSEQGGRDSPSGEHESYHGQLAAGESERQVGLRFGLEMPDGSTRALKALGLRQSTPVP